VALQVITSINAITFFKDRKNKVRAARFLELEMHTFSHNAILRKSRKSLLKTINSTV